MPTYENMKKLEEQIIKNGYKMKAKSFVKEYKHRQATPQKIYYYLRKNGLPTYREWAKENERFEREIIERAKERISSLTK